MNKAKTGWHNFIHNPQLACINRVVALWGLLLRSQSRWVALLKHLACLDCVSWLSSSLRAPLPEPFSCRKEMCCREAKALVRRESFPSGAEQPDCQWLNLYLLLTAVETWAFSSTLLCLSFFSCRKRSLKRVAGYENWCTYIILFWRGLLISWYHWRCLRKDNYSHPLGRGNSALHVLSGRGFLGRLLVYLYRASKFTILNSTFVFAQQHKF